MSFRKALPFLPVNPENSGRDELHRRMSELELFKFNWKFVNNEWINYYVMVEY